jgi:nucleoside-diphosphate kinase
MEYTLSIIKPDGVKKNIIGEVIKRFETNQVKIFEMRMLKLTKEKACAFYKVHKDKPFYNSLTDFMSSGSIVVMVLGAEDVISKNRKLMGATDYKKADPGTIRYDFASSIEQNIVHGSDSPETAKEEIKFFFPEFNFYTK